MNNLEELQKKVDTLEKQIKLLTASSTIPFDVDKAFKTRLQIDSLAKITTSSKSASSEQIAVNSATSTPVMLSPDAFLQVTVSGTIYYIPVFT